MRDQQPAAGYIVTCLHYTEKNTGKIKCHIARRSLESEEGKASYAGGTQWIESGLWWKSQTSRLRLKCRSLNFGSCAQ